MKKIITVLFLLGMGAWPIAGALEENGKQLFRSILEDNSGAAAASLDAGVSPNVRDARGNPALIVAINRKRSRIVTLLLARGADANLANAADTTPLMAAAAKGYTRIMKKLLKHGAEVNLQNSQSGATALMYAARRNRVGAVRLLLDNHADATLLDRDGNSVQHIARGNKAILDLLTLLAAATSNTAAISAAAVPASPPLPVPPQHASAPLFDPPALREKVPLDALAYFRIPHFWGLFSAPKDNSLKPALGHEQHLASIKKLEASVYKNVLKKAETFTHPGLSLLFHHLRAPVEAVVLLPEKTPPTLSNVLVSTRLDLHSAAGFQALLENLLAKTPGLQLVSQLSPQGHAALKAGDLPIFLHYDTNTRALNLMGGMAATQESFTQTLEQQKQAPAGQHPMYALEDRIDASRQGVFQWLNMQRLLPFLQGGMPPKVAQMMQKWGLFDIRAFSLGWGDSGGKSRLAFMIDMPKTGYREFFPTISNDPALTAAGRPSAVAALSLPLQEIFLGAEKVAEQEMPPEKIKQYQAFKANFLQMTGFSIKEGLDAFGPEIIFFTDEVGAFLALQAGNPEQLRKVIDYLVKTFTLAHETRDIRGKTYHHLTGFWLSDQNAKAAKKTAGNEAEVFAIELLQKIGSHFYWMEDEGYLIFAQVPQLLLDRQRHPLHVSVRDWLKRQQKQDIRSSMLLLSVAVSDIPRHLYYAYLQLVNGLADMAGEKIDLFSLPTAMDLNLPASGTYGLQLDLSDSLLALEFTFENNPLEFFLKTNMSSVAVTGIVAAVAIPAYSDYLKRATVAEALSLLGGLKTPAEEFYGIKGRLPEMAEIGAKIGTKRIKNIRLLDSKDGYAAEFENSHLKGRVMLLYDAKKRIWTCASEGMKKAYLPSSCTADH
ncbi:MAG: hypothetical protein GY862_13470 [Gammaproteobacteria bacterium]|nr:hypothetical protein [Gammaproteobacteria bacterium]